MPCKKTVSASIVDGDVGIRFCVGDIFDVGFAENVVGVGLVVCVIIGVAIVSGEVIVGVTGETIFISVGIVVERTFSLD